VDPNILDPRQTYEDVEEWNVKAIKLADLFTENFEKFTDTPAGEALRSVGLQLIVLII
jgi:phosphoenolpyruvate carboxykinase (ATP)